MRNFIFILLLITLSSCGTIKHAVGGALGGGLTAAFLPEPAAVAAGAAAGVVVTELILPSASPKAIAGQMMAGGPVQGTTASALHETGGLIKTLGYWWLILFVFLPLFRKNGRNWFKKFGQIHNTVSQADIDARDDEQDVIMKHNEGRIVALEELLKDSQAQSESKA
tara:strand:- start:2305 stop:2805 length:501 start_codon:yes stop_codon:yes gene_type:complete